MHNYGGEIDTGRWQKLMQKSKPAENLNPIKERWPCYHLWLAPAVAWNGKFLMCCADPHQKEVFGDINKETVNECWQRLEKVRQSHLEGKYEGICKKCDVWREYPDIFFHGQKKSS